MNRLAIVSSSSMEVIKHVTSEINIEKYVNVIVSGETFKESKPNSEIYCFTLKKLGLDAEECLAIEDSTYGI